MGEAAICLAENNASTRGTIRALLHTLYIPSGVYPRDLKDLEVLVDVRRCSTTHDRGQIAVEGCSLVWREAIAGSGRVVLLECWLDFIMVLINRRILLDQKDRGEKAGGGQRKR